MRIGRQVQLPANDARLQLRCTVTSIAKALEDGSQVSEKKHIYAGVSGNVRVAVARLIDTGLSVSGFSRNVYLGLASNLNAELSVGNTTAGVSNKIDGLALVSVGPSNYSARLGSGGPRIEVSNVTGFIVLQRI